MSWDKKYYKSCRKHMDYMVSHRPFLFEGTVIDWLKGWSTFVKDLADSGDYEAAQASKDAIFAFIEKVTNEPVPKEAKLIFN